MASLRQHYESIRGNKSLIGGALGFALSVAFPIGIAIYRTAEGAGGVASKPTENYARVIEIENELNKELRVGEVNYELSNKVGILRVELDNLNSNSEIKIERLNFEKKQAINITLNVCGATVPMAGTLISFFPFISGNEKRKRKLEELTGEK